MAQRKSVFILLQGSTEWQEVKYGDWKFHFFVDYCNGSVQVYSYDEIELLKGQSAKIKLVFD